MESILVCALCLPLPSLHLFNFYETFILHVYIIHTCTCNRCMSLDHLCILYFLDPIDLTQDEDEALQRALALSMQDVHHQEGHVVSQEDQDLSR